MAGEVKSQLTVNFAGGVGGPSGGQAQAPVSRQTHLLGPGAAMSNYAAERQLRWSRVMAMEAADDRRSMEDIHRGLEKLEVQRSLEVSSARRAAEARFQQRQAFLENVRARRGGVLDDGDFDGGRVGRRVLRSGASASKRLLRNFGIGVAAGVASHAILQDFTSDDGGLFGAVSRIGLQTVSGGAWGGVAGAVGQAFSTTLSEVIRALGEAGKETEALRKSLAEIRKDLRQMLIDSEAKMIRLNEDLKREFDEQIRLITSQTLFGYREERFAKSNLVN